MKFLSWVSARFFSETTQTYWKIPGDVGPRTSDLKGFILTKFACNGGAWNGPDNSWSQS